MAEIPCEPIIEYPIIADLFSIILNIYIHVYTVNRQNKDLNDRWYHGSLMKVESIAECSARSILQYF